MDVGIGMGLRGCVRQPFLDFPLLPRGASKGLAGQQAVGEGVGDSALFLIFLSCHDELGAQTQERQVRALSWVEPFPSSHEFTHVESRAPAPGSTKSSGRLLADFLAGDVGWLAG